LEFRLQTSSRKELTRWILSWMPHVQVLASRHLPHSNPNTATLIVLVDDTAAKPQESDLDKLGCSKTGA